MEKNIKQVDLIKLIKQIKSSVNLKYTNISKNNNPIKSPKPKSEEDIFKTLFSEKNNKNEVPISLQNPFSPKIKQSQLTQNKPKQEKCVVFNLCHERKRPATSKIQPKTIGDVKIYDIQIDVKQPKFIDVSPKKIIQSVFLSEEKKKQQALISDIQKLSDHIENQISQSYQSTQFDSIQSCENYQINDINVGSSSQNLNSFKKKGGFQSIQLEINNSLELNAKLHQLQNLIKCDSNVELKLKTNFENFNGLFNFCIKFLKFGNQLRYLIWKVKGCFQDDGQTNIIGQLISRFTDLYRFELNISAASFSDSAALNISNGLKQLTNLHVLKVNIYKIYIGYQVYPIQNKEWKSIEQIASTISNLPNLEILYSNNNQIMRFSPPKKLSNFNYKLNLQNEFSELKQSKDLTKQQNYITKIHIESDGYYFSNNITKQHIKELKSLKYLTHVSFNNLKNDELVFGNQLKKISFEKMRHLLMIISLKNTMRQFIPINPVMVMTDLWID